MISVDQLKSKHEYKIYYQIYNDGKGNTPIQYLDKKNG
jgi:hypothetical protein